ncbi:hypothetical protein [Streptomyces sp. NPDC059874]|uniref:hypothetical protein n=1 Tax=Streptomyces sp. NPDC059874 TaxID=3346983 RepID=UPI0036638A6A
MNEKINVVSVRGGKVHTATPDHGDHPFPLCRTGDMTNSGTKYRTTAAPVDCKTCGRYIALREEREAAEMQPTHGESSDAPSDMMPETDTKETPTMDAKKTAPAAPAPAKPDTDQLISDVHDVIDRIKVMAHQGPSTANAITELTEEADALIRQLPADKRVSLRADVKAAGELPSGDTAPAPVSGTVVVREAEDFNEIEGVPDLVAEAKEKFTAGIALGVKTAGVAEEVASVIINMRSKITNPDTGLPDLLSDRKTTKNAAAEIYNAVRKGVDDDDMRAVAAYDSVARSVRNKMTDVFVDWVRAMDTPESYDAFKELFPAAAEMVEKSAETATAMANDPDVAEEDVPTPLSPSEALHKLYASKGVKLPERGRTEIERERKQIAALNKARLELAAATEAAEEATDAEKKKELEAEAEKAAAQVKTVEAKLPEKVLKELPAPVVKTKGDRLKEKVTKSRDFLSAATDEAAFKKLEADEKTALLAQLEALSGFIATQVAALKAK